MKNFRIGYLVLLVVLFSERAAGEGNKTITWWDGENEAKVWLEEGFVASLEYPKIRNASPFVRLIAVRNRNQRRELLKRHQPVFRNAETGGQKMVATGNVLVRFSPELDAAQAEAWAKEHETTVVEKISFEPSTYFFFTAPGYDAIEKANAWKKVPGVKGSEPQWWREMQPR